MEKFVKLSNGVLMPIIGFGTYQIKSSETIYTALEAALAAGYRHIDTASGYHNEHHIGESLQKLLPKFGLARSDVFITSKVGPSYQGNRASILECVQKSLGALQTHYLDLCLIHWPGTQRLDVCDPSNTINRHVTWEILTELYLEPQSCLKAIGVSNYTVKHLQEMESYKVYPHVNQVEMHPHFSQVELLQYCTSHDIVLQAYSSLGTSSPHRSLLTDATVMNVAEDSNMTPAQVLLCWSLLQGVVVLPKSTNAEHIRTNYDSINKTLTPEQMKQLNQISIRRKYAWDPETVV